MNSHEEKDSEKLGAIKRIEKKECESKNADNEKKSVEKRGRQR